jgi:conjugal transfer/type IV secretion protein DotA/TraY
MKLGKVAKWATAPLWLPLLPIYSNIKRNIRQHESQVRVIKGLLGKEVPQDVVDEANPLPEKFDDAITQAQQSWAKNGHDFTVERVLKMMLIKKRILLAGIYFCWSMGLFLLFNEDIISAVTLIVFGSLAISFVFPNQFRRWQLTQRRLTAEEKGSVANFMQETSWFRDCLSFELTRKAKQTVISGLFVAVLMFPFLSHADKLSEITNASDNASDLSRQALVTLFGQVVNDPLAVGSEDGGDTLIAQIFKVFSSGLLIIATGTTGYLLLKKTAHGAHEGQFLDNQQHSLWMPIRVLSGISLLVPTANGWSLSQLIMLYAASKVGVGLANMGSDAAIDAFMSGQTFVLQPVAPSTESLSRSLFDANLCMFGINASLDQVKANGGITYSSDYVNQGPIANGFILKSSSFTCGGSTMAIEQKESLLQQLGVVASVDTNVLRTAHQQGLEAMQEALRTGAESFVNSVIARQQGGGGQLPNAEATIQHASQIYENRVTAALHSQASNGQLKSLTSQIAESVKSEGWWALGGWYQTMAVANTRITDAAGAKATSFGKSNNQLPATADLYELIVAAFRAQQSITDNANAGVLTAKSNYQANATSDSSGVFGMVFGSLGQSLTAKLINFSVNDNGQVNPLIAMKNLGDYVITGSEAGLAAYAASSAIIYAADDSALGKVANFFTGAPAAIKGALTVLSPFLVIIFTLLFSCGIALAVYLPLLPFIIWISACINWLVILGEAIFASPLWGFAHLNGEGEGMGPKTAHGYIFLLNLIFRPILMVGGFFLGGGLLVVGGTLINKMLPAAIGNAQFDSVTGLASIIGYLVLYCGLCITLVNTSFSLINIVPDQVISWVGGHASSHLGRELSDKSGQQISVLAGKSETVINNSKMSGGPAKQPSSDPSPKNNAIK